MSGDHPPRKKDLLPNEFFPAWAGPEYWLFFQELQTERAREEIEKTLKALRSNDG